MYRKVPVWLLIMASGIAGALAARTYLQRSSSDLYRYGKDLPEVLYLVEKAYVDKIEMAQLMQGAFQGSLESIDENASYIAIGDDPKDRSLEIYLKTGMAVVKRKGYPYIMTVAAGSPADALGIEAGAYIRGLNNKSSRGQSIFEFRQQLLEKPSVSLHLLGTDAKKKLKPTSFTLAPLGYEERCGLHLLTLKHAYEGLAYDLDQCLASLPKDARLVLDLRGNALGDRNLLDLLAARFLKKGLLAAWADPQKNVTPIDNKVDGRALAHPLFVVMDQTTSRSAETFCAVAQQQKTAILLGQRSLGLPGHYENIALKQGGYVSISTHELRLASDEVLTGNGVSPDRKVAVPAFDEGFLQAALDLITASDVKVLESGPH